MTDSSNMNLVKLIEQFRSEEKCRDYLEALRWPRGPVCPRCASDSISTIGERNQFDCNECRYQFSVTVDTIFHNSKIPLWKWLLTIYLMLESKKGISAHQIKRTIGVSYKTAWYLCHRIRAAMTEDNPDPLHGIVEVDETWIGGKTKGFGHGYRGNKTIVVGVMKRGGSIRLKKVENANRKTLHAFIKEHVADDVEAIYTDEWKGYGNLSDEDTKHEKVNHSAEEWVRGDVHTNSIEGIWSLFKRSIVGAFHHISPKHLDAYLDELEWRFNNRDNDYMFRDTLIKLLAAESLSFDDLTSKAG